MSPPSNITYFGHRWTIPEFTQICDLVNSSPDAHLFLESILLLHDGAKLVARLYPNGQPCSQCIALEFECIESQYVNLKHKLIYIQFSFMNGDKISHLKEVTLDGKSKVVRKFMVSNKITNSTNLSKTGLVLQFNVSIFKHF